MKKKGVLPKWLLCSLCVCLSFTHTSGGISGPKVCKVHKEALAKGQVPIAYGLPVGDTPEYARIRKALFPNAREYVLGGCVIGKRKYAEVSYCQKCRDAKREWEKQQEKAGGRDGAG